MKVLRFFGFLSLLLSCSSVAIAQQTSEVTVTFNEPFFDALLDALFQNGGPPEIPISRTQRSEISSVQTAAYHGPCTETIKLLRENQSVRTAVRFRDGKIYMPIAFSGGYNPPLVGCVEFSGYAETNVDLEYDRQNKRLIGTVRVLSVSLNGTAGMGSSILTKMVQSAIDKRMNPIEIIRADKLSFSIPVQNSVLKMEAAAIRSEVVNNTLLVHIDYTFPK
jgi:hypothetical protein